MSYAHELEEDELSFQEVNYYDPSISLPFPSEDDACRSWDERYSLISCIALTIFAGCGVQLIFGTIFRMAAVIG